MNAPARIAAPFGALALVLSAGALALSLLGTLDCGRSGGRPPEAPARDGRALGGTQAGNASASASARPPPGETPGEAQRRRGAKFWSYECVACHGAAGEGGSGGPTVGPRALARFATARDLYAFVRGHMPTDFPGGMDEQAYWDVVTHVLAQNRVTLEAGVLDATNAAQLRLSVARTP